MIVRMFQPRFANLVAAGMKRQTVRKTPKRLPKRGDEISCRQWRGRPYRSKQIELRRGVVESVHRITIEPDELTIDGVKSSAERMRKFAEADGFVSYGDLLQWFRNTHGLPFSGIVICWEPHPLAGNTTRRESVRKSSGESNKGKGKMSTEKMLEVAKDYVTKIAATPDQEMKLIQVIGGFIRQLELAGQSVSE